MRDERNKIKLAVYIASFLFLLIVIVGIMGALGLFDRNPNGVETKIDNFSQYLRSMKKDSKYDTFTALYNIIKLNGKTPPRSGALIREGTFKNTINTDDNDTEFNFSTFIVDIEDIQQSYYAQIAWSDNEEAELGGYPILFTCPTKEQLIYPAFECSDLLTETEIIEEYNKFPIINVLPVEESYYNSDYTEYTYYTIQYKLSDTKEDLTLVITDYSGNSKEKALQKIRNLGYNPDDYNIEYINDSSDGMVE